MTRSPWRFLPLGALAVILGCGQPQAAQLAPTKPEPTPPAAPVVAKADGKPSPKRVIERPAHIEAFEETPLVFRIAGYVQKVNVDIGDRVRKGDVLADLHVPEMEVEVRQKEAVVRQAEAEVKLAKDHVPLAEAEFKRLKSQAERFAKVGSGVLDKENIEETQYAFEASKARLEIARSDVVAKEARLAVAQANRDYAQTMLGYGKILAPYDGVIVRRHVNTGHLLQPGAGAVANPIFVVARTDKVRVFVEVPENDATAIKEGMPARVRVQALRDAVLEGKVTRSSWSLDAKARTLRVEVDLENPDGRLRPAMYAYVTLQPD